MAHDVTDLLDRQTEFLLRRPTDAEFLIQVPTYLRALRDEPRLAIHMEDLLREATALLSRHEAHDARAVPELVTLRDELVALAPKIDDAAASPPTDGAPTALLAWRLTLAAFDRLVAGDLAPYVSDGRPAHGKTRALIAILNPKLALLQHPVTRSAQGERHPIEDNQRPDLDEIGRRLGNVARRDEHFTSEVQLEARTSAGFSLGRLDLVLSALNPPPAVIESPDDIPMFLNDVFGYITTGSYSLFRAVHGGRLSVEEGRLVAERVTELRQDVDRLREELRRRVGATATRTALVLRFKHRAEWYDRTRLQALAGQDGPGTIEDRLTGELVRFSSMLGLARSRSRWSAVLSRTSWMRLCVQRFTLRRSSTWIRAARVGRLPARWRKCMTPPEPCAGNRLRCKRRLSSCFAEVVRATRFRPVYWGMAGRRTLCSWTSRQPTRAAVGRSTSP